MPIAFRFSRRRDRSLRLRITGTGPDCDALYAATSCPRGARPGEPQEAFINADGPRIDDLIATLHAAGGPLGEAAASIEAAHTRLLAQPAPAPLAPGVDDAALRAAVRARHLPELGGLLIDELQIGGGLVRVDVAHLTADLWTGIELKGERDTLMRLPRQVAEYSAIFDRCELVTTARHLEHAVPLLPPWWQVTVADDDAHLDTIRPGELNPAPSSAARVALMWRDEALEHLKAAGRGARMSSARRDTLHAAIADGLDPGDARAISYAALAGRGRWLADDGASRRTPAPQLNPYRDSAFGRPRACPPQS